MDSDEFRAILSRSRVEIWAMIDAAIRVASSDHAEEFRRRRDRIVESLYAPVAQLCPNCAVGGGESDAAAAAAQEHRLHHDNNMNNNSCYNDDDDDDDDDKSHRNLGEDHSKTPLTPESNNRDFSGEENEDDADPYAELLDDKPGTILSIKELLEDPNQSEDDVIRLLQNLADMDITFQALKETDIGRHVNRLRKHSSNEVRRIVKQLVRKWKETVDEWVKVNQPQVASDLIADVDSPQQNISKYQQNGHQQVPDFGYSPNPRVGSSRIERNYVDHDTKHRPSPSIPRRETPSRPQQSAPKSAATVPPPNRAPQRELAMDDARLNSARRRLQENYQEAQNAKKQRTIQVMDIHDLPKPKNTFFAKNKGGGFQGRNQR